jgi:hypothetical protein
MDNTLLELAIKRRLLIFKYAHLLTRFGPSHSDRSRLNEERAKKRKAVRKQLRSCDALIVKRVMELTEVIK